MIKNILGRIFAFWALLTFIITFLIIFIPSMLSYLMKNPKGQNYFITVSRWWMNFWLIIIGCPAKVNGKENFKAGENYIVTYNHNAMLDVPLSAPFIPGPNKTIAKSSFAKVPVFGWFYKRGAVLVDRKDDRSRIKSFEEMKTVLASQLHMCIYPEGTRNRTSEPLKPFYDGAFKLAVETKKEIIPGIIIGTKKAMPINKTFYLWPTRLQLYFLPAISPENLTTKELKEKVFKVMEEFYVGKVDG